MLAPQMCLFWTYVEAENITGAVLSPGQNIGIIAPLLVPVDDFRDPAFSLWEAGPIAGKSTCYPQNL